MSFSKLPLEVKVKIFSLLSIGERYNASLVWKEMSDETWKLIPSAEDLIKKLSDRYLWLEIKTLQDLGFAGVLASAGHLDSVKKLYFENIDLTIVPINIIGNLAKTATRVLFLNGVKGFNFSILANIKSKMLGLKDMTLPENISQDISVESEITLGNVSGNVIGFFERIKCYELLIKEMSLNKEESLSLAGILDSKVRELQIVDGTCDVSLLANYDGQGRCSRMMFREKYYDRLQDIIKYENLVTWANTKEDWTVTYHQDFGGDYSEVKRQRRKRNKYD